MEELPKFSVKKNRQAGISSKKNTYEKGREKSSCGKKKWVNKIKVTEWDVDSPFCVALTKRKHRGVQPSKKNRKKGS